MEFANPLNLSLVLFSLFFVVVAVMGRGRRIRRDPPENYREFGGNELYGAHRGGFYSLEDENDAGLYGRHSGLLYPSAKLSAKGNAFSHSGSGQRAS